jgi:hypothetical protein
LPDLDAGTDSTEKELAIFGWELDHLKWDILENINRKQDTKDKQDAESLLDTLQDNNSNTDDKKNITSSKNIIPLNIQKTIEEKIWNEDPLANQWRAESYTKVSDFATTVAQQWWIFGRLVSWLS